MELNVYLLEVEKNKRLYRKYVLLCTYTFIN